MRYTLTASGLRATVLLDHRGTAYGPLTPAQSRLAAMAAEAVASGTLPRTPTGPFVRVTFTRPAAVAEAIEGLNPHAGRVVARSASGRVLRLPPPPGVPPGAVA